MGQGLSGHQSTAATSNDWLTPPEIIRALGDFDLDPAVPCQMAHSEKGLGIDPRPWATARRMFCRCMNGLVRTWPSFERVWLNPPYDEHIGSWLLKLDTHGDGIALVFARTDTGWFQSQIFEKANALFFPMRRIRFYKPDGTKGSYTGGAPSVFAAYGERNVQALASLQMDGRLVKL